MPKKPMPQGAIAARKPSWGRGCVALAWVNGNLDNMEDSLGKKLLN